MQNLIKLTIEKSQNLEEYVETIKQKSQSLQEEKRSLLVNNGYARISLSRYIIAIFAGILATMKVKSAPV